MRKLSVYRCKRCNALIDCDDLDFLTETGFDKAFASKSKGVVYRPIISENRVTEAIIHRCDPDNIGICELIGWRKIE